MPIVVTFTFLKNVVDRKARSSKRVPRSSVAREETIRIELTIANP